MAAVKRECQRAFGRTILVVISALALALMSASTPASALTWLGKLCVGYSGCAASGRGNGGYASAGGTSYWRMYAGHNCTNYVAFREIQNGAPGSLSYNLGNATTWGTVAASHGVSVNSTPAVGAVAWFSGSSGVGSDGHVAYVEAIDGNKVTVSEDNWGGDFDWRQYYISDVSGFIHFKDVSTSNPFGSLDVAASTTPGVIHVSGWAADPDAKSGPLAVHIYANDQAIAVTANVYRPDVPKVIGAGYGDHLGFDADLQFQRTGNLNVCAYAINAGSGDTNTKLGCKSVNVVNPLAFGSFDAASDLGGQQVRVTGWAADANKPSGPLAVHLYANGSYVGSLTANAYRPDVPKVIGSRYSDRLGFDAVVSVPSSGKVHICAYGINVGPGWVNSELGCKDISVSATLTGPSPSIQGKAKVGKRLTCKPGVWHPDGVTFSYQWLRNGSRISGATKATYKLTKASKGKRISVVLVGHKAGYADVARTSAKTGKVKK